MLLSRTLLVLLPLSSLEMCLIWVLTPKPLSPKLQTLTCQVFKKIV